MKHLQGIADLGNEAGLLRRELSAVRAELRNALEANKDLRDRLLARELGGEKDIREAYRIAVERIKRLEDALRMALEIIDHADPEAWANGNEAFGVDEGKVLAGRAVDDCRKALEVKP